MKLRYLPWKRQKGCRALTTPAPWVQRLPAPPARASTATSPSARAAAPRRRHCRRRLRAGPAVDHVAAADVLDHGAGRQAVLGQPDPARPQVGADLLVQFRIEAVLVEQALQARPGRVAPRWDWGTGRRGADRSSRPGGDACGRRRRIGRSRSRTVGLSLADVLAQPLRRADRVIARRHEGVIAPAQSSATVPRSLMAKS